MPALLTYYRTLLAGIAARGRGEHGITTTETVILTAVLALGALTAAGIIINKVMSSANSIPTP